MSAAFLSADILDVLAEYLTLEELLGLRVVCKTWRDMLGWQKPVWKNVLRRQGGTHKVYGKLQLNQLNLQELNGQNS
jgi:hypothetical protein